MMPSNRSIMAVGSLLLLLSSAVSVAGSVAYALNGSNRYAAFVLVSAAVLAVSSVFAGVVGPRARSSVMSIVVLVSAAVAVLAHSVVTSDLLGIVGQPIVGYTGVAAGLTLFVGVAYERIDRDPSTAE